MTPVIRRRRARAPAPAICILCRAPIDPADLADAWTRTLTDVGPATVERAHRECAFEAGLLDPPDPRTRDAC
ncbi:MAG: hypothetical protein L6R43_01780 [Planctomycetes bacterium]|nr:hypothetical protein [Planctomycetota bacterium]